MIDQDKDAEKRPDPKESEPPNEAERDPGDIGGQPFTRGEKPAKGPSRITKRDEG